MCYNTPQCVHEEELDKEYCMFYITHFGTFIVLFCVLE